MQKKLTLTSALFLLGAATTLPVQAKPYTPARGSAERGAIMNALRPFLGGGRHKAIITPDHFKAERGWTYLTGDFEYANGAPLEPRFKEGSATHFSALLRYEKGKWRVKRRVYNGDVVEPEFMKAFPQAPKSIFRYD